MLYANPVYTLLLGILVFILPFDFFTPRDHGRTKVAAATNSVGSIRIALEMYMLDHETYPLCSAGQLLTDDGPLEPYLTNIDATLADFLNNRIVAYEGGVSDFTIVVTAKDRPDPNRTLIRGTAGTIKKFDADTDSDWVSMK